MTIRKTIISILSIDLAIDPFATCHGLNKEMQSKMMAQRLSSFQGLSWNWKWVYFLFSMGARETIKIKIEQTNCRGQGYKTITHLNN